MPQLASPHTNEKILLKDVVGFGGSWQSVAVHWQLPPFHLQDEALLELDLRWTCAPLIGDEGLDVLEQRLDLYTLLLQISLKPVISWHC